MSGPLCFRMRMVKGLTTASRVPRLASIRQPSRRQVFDLEPDDGDRAFDAVPILEVHALDPFEIFLKRQFPARWLRGGEPR